MAVDIIIISNAKNKELEELTKNGLRSLFKSEDKIKFNVFIIESTKDINYNNIHPNITTIYLNEKFGYNKFLNFGRKLGNSEYVALCNNDLIYHKNWATNLISEMEKAKIKSASPISNYPHLTKFKTNLKPIVQFGYEIRQKLTGWCIFQKRDIYDIIGDLDEQFTFWYCDNDYGLTLEKHNLKHALITTARVDHIESSTLKTCSLNEKTNFTHAQTKIFKDKWNLNH